MSIEVALHHRTEYRYDRLISLGPQVVRLRPAPHARTPILSYSLTVEPKPHFLNWQQDPQGNYLARLVFPEKTRPPDRHRRSRRRHGGDQSVRLLPRAGAEKFPFAYDPALANELAPFRVTMPAGPLLRQYLAQIDRTAERTIDFLVALNGRLQRDIRYIVRLEPGVQTPEETLDRGEGSCRDTAWLLVQILRHLGFAARFVSGYLIQLVADVKPLEGPAGPTADFTDLHAWCEVYLPGAGWIGLDPTSGSSPAKATFRSPARPIRKAPRRSRGTLEQCETVMQHDMSVRRVAEAPRVTKPYDDAAWRASDGARRAGSTAISPPRMSASPWAASRPSSRPTIPMAPEWNTDALGPTKRRLCRRAAAPPRRPLRHGPAAALRPGQMVSRASSCRAGRCLPLAQGRRADLAGPGAFRRRRRRQPGARPRGSRSASRPRLAERLQIDPALVRPGLRGQLVLPVAGAPAAGQCRSAQERAQGSAGARAPGADLRAGPEARRGLRPAAAARRARRRAALAKRPVVPPVRTRCSCCRAIRRWAIACRSIRCPRSARATIPTSVPQDPTERARPAAACARHCAGSPRAAVPRHRAARLAGRQRREQVPLQPAPGEPDASVVRTALCVEVRGGLLHVFMPPVEYRRGLSRPRRRRSRTSPRRVRTARRRSRAIRRPSIRACMHFSVTPDPGVIEVNVHPAQTWSRARRSTRQSSMKRRARPASSPRNSCSTAGMSAPAAAITSPSAARAQPTRRCCAGPICSRACIGYWHNHPSLSYLFSGLFIGPTSQHPRVDEAPRRCDIRARDRLQGARRAPSRRRPGWPTACSATCSST